MRRPFIFTIFLIAAIGPFVQAAPPNTVPKSECRSQIDLVLVVDGSDSISRPDYVKQRLALAEMIREMEIRPTASRVGIVVYSSSIAQTVELSYNKQELIRKAQTLVHPRDGTNTNMGIDKMIQVLKKGREKVPWVCIVITDGLSKEPNLTAASAQRAKDMGVNMFAVGISSLIQKEELENIASSPEQVLMLTSFDQLRVSLSGLMKVVCPCPVPPPIKYSTVNNGSRAIGTTRTYMCEDGFQPMGDPNITCGMDALWTTLSFSCNACSEPIKEYGRGIITPGPLLLRTTREYKCVPGYTSPVPLTTTCVEGTAGPFWTEPETYCRACTNPLNWPDSYVDSTAGDTLIGVKRRYHCNKGFIPTGPIESECVDIKGLPKWKKPAHGCIACGNPPILPYALIDDKPARLVGSVRIYTCIPGYHPTGPMKAVCMGENGATFWKTTDHFCTACKEPPILQDAVLDNRGDTLVGSVRTYLCLTGFQATGPIEVRCSAEAGKTYWEGPHHLCKPCLNPPILPNSILDMAGGTLVGTVRTYGCMNGYIPSGPIQVGCVEGPKGPIWTSPEFQCITCTMPPTVPFAVMDPKGDNLVGTERFYHCIKGYIPSKPGPIISKCFGEYVNGRGVAKWSEPSHFCRTCPDPPTLELGEVEGLGSNLIGSVRNYVCTKGFYATGPITIRCMEDGKWSIPDHSCTACGPTPLVTNANITGGLHTLGTIRKYRCYPGFTPSDIPEIICLKNAQWSPVKFTCIACKEPYGHANAVLEPGEQLIGVVRRYTCLPGYLATGPITSTCALPQGIVVPDWSTPVHYCKDCGDPYPVVNAIPVKGKKTIGAVQQYLCKPGYVPSAPPLAHCMPNAEWTPPDFKCIVCGEPPRLFNASVDTVGNTMVGTIRSYKCDKGFIATGPLEVLCDAPQTDGYQIPYWKRLTDNYCRDCGLPPNVTHGLWLDGPKTIGSVAQYVCEPGYVPSAPPEIFCNSNGIWMTPNFTCSGCLVTPVIPYAQLVSSAQPLYTTGSILQYECVPGYVVVGGLPEMTCLNDATWSLQSFHCALTCSEPPIYSDAILEGGGNLLGDVRSYACRLGFKTVGDATVTCQDTGLWSLRTFECSKCLPAPELPYAIPMSGDSQIASEVPYQCKDGFVSDGPVVSTCQFNLTWSTPAHNCYGCITTPVIDNTLPLMGEQPMYPIGTNLTYVCLAGYLPTATPALQCLPGGVWTAQAFQCLISCGEPTLYPDATVDQGGIIFGATRQYMCVQGLKTVGNNIVTCLSTGLWSERLFNCTKCLPAPELPYAIPMSGDSQIASEVPYQCKDGFVSDGPVVSTCQFNLTWSTPAHNCYGCITTPVIDNTLPLMGEQPMYPIGTNLTYVCLAGYLPTATPSLQCLPGGVWTTQAFQCLISCGEPTLYPDSTVDQGGIIFGATRQYMCVQGLKTVGNNIVTCLSTGLWSERLFNCTKCLPAPELPYAIPMSGDSQIASEVPYQCKDGFVSDGPVVSTCQFNLTWSIPAHNCYGCITTPVIDNTLPLMGEQPMYPIGTNLTYVCLAGYLPTATPSLQCIPGGVWTTQAFQCLISCGEPTLYPDSTVDHGGIIFGAKRQYTCVQGLKNVGNNIVTCLSTGLWSERLFNCTKCRPAPELEYAVPLPGDSFIGSEVTYQCKHGLISNGSVTSVCNSDLKWTAPANPCYDCGPPHSVPNAYFRLGKSTMGSLRRYACEGNYDMSGNDTIVCQSDATWSQPAFTCYVRTTTTTTTPVPVKEDPSVCDGCRMLNGVGYIGHPYDCSQYIQCFYSSRGIESVYMPCPFGQYWDQGDLTCKPADDVDCPHERCLDTRIKGYKHSDSTKCCAYWTCVNGKSQAKCCGNGFKFDEDYGCMEDALCTAACPWDDDFYDSNCDKRPLLDKTRYEQHIGNGFYVKMPCPLGTGFNPVDCDCTLLTSVVPGYTCRPELLMDFDDDDISDVSGRNVYVNNEGVYPYKGAAYFDGNSRLIINRFSNTEFTGNLVIKLRYKEQLSGPTANALQALITNGDCGDDPTVIVAKMPGYVLLGAKTDRAKSFAIPVIDKEWKEVIYIHNEKKLEGRVCGSSYNKWSWGPIQSTHCGLQIGYGSKLPNFVGLIDDITLFQCRPDDTLLTVYGGPRPTFDDSTSRFDDSPPRFDDSPSRFDDSPPRFDDRAPPMPIPPELSVH